MSEKLDAYMTKTWGEGATSIQRDLFLNFTKIMTDSPLDETDRYLNLAAISRSLHLTSLEKFATDELTTKGLAPEAVQEAVESAAIMGMLNTYYKFKGYLSPESLPNFPRAGLRMNSLSKPVNGKEKFEMMSFSVSVVNGCPTCISSHEKALSQLGVEADKIHELARLASVVKGLSALNVIG